MSDAKSKAMTHPGKVRDSRGVPNFVWGLMVLAAAVVFMQGAFVIHFSDYGRVWPSTDSMKFPLDAPIPGR